MFTTHLPVVGDVYLYVNSLFTVGHYFYVNGYDDEDNTIQLVLDKFHYPNDISAEYGYIHIVSYTIGHVTRNCSLFRSIG